MIKDLIPYVKRDGEWSISLHTIIGIYDCITKTGIDEKVFVDGDIKNADDWLILCQNPANCMHIIVKDSRVEFVAWLNSWGYNSAFGHFFAMNSGNGMARKNGLKTIDYWFNHLKTDSWRLDAILGRIPSTNVKAIKYVMGLGFRRLGDIPSIKYKGSDDRGATLFVMER